MTPSLVILGAPYGWAIIALRPFGPSVTCYCNKEWRQAVNIILHFNENTSVDENFKKISRKFRSNYCKSSRMYVSKEFLQLRSNKHPRTWTASAKVSTPLSMAARPSTPNLISLLMKRTDPCRDVARAATFVAWIVDRSMVLLVLLKQNVGIGGAENEEKRSNTFDGGGGRSEEREHHTSFSRASHARSLAGLPSTTHSTQKYQARYRKLSLLLWKFLFRLQCCESG